jgi:Putative zinc-finger
MNCKQTEELLPLFAGHELEEHHAQRVTEHLQTCTACAQVAGEYRESIQLTEQFAPPIFSDAVYAGIRQRVLREIEAEAAAPAWLQSIANLFRPGLPWAIASVLLIAISLFAVYFFVKKQGNEPQLADIPPLKIQQEESDPGSQAYNEAQVRAGEKKEQLAGITKPPRKRSSAPVATKTRDTWTTTNNVSAQTSSLPGKALRLEIQTKDPNIRIIWFVQHEPQPAIQNSKGI